MLNRLRRIGVRWLIAIAATLCATFTIADSSTYELRTFAQGLVHPWCLAFLPDGRMLVTERGGQLRYVAPDGTLGEPISGLPAPYVRSQGGLFDVLLAPDFATSDQLYLSFAQGTPDSNATRVVRARLINNALWDIKTIVEVSPRKDTPVHYGGRLAWDATGALIVTTGDGFNFREAAQDPRSLLGKILRVAADGSTPRDNPYADGSAGHPLVFSLGHRNPQGLAVDTQRGHIYANEHGPQGGDELNLISATNNYGWPMVSFGVDYNGALISPFSERPGLTQPLAHWTPSIGASGMAQYRGDAFPQWRGDLFVGALVERSVRRLSFRNGEVAEEEILFRELDERIRDVRVGPDGLIYLLTDSPEARIVQVIPASGP